MTAAASTAAILLAALACGPDRPVLITFFTHMEGSFAYPTEAAFANHAAALRRGMDVAEAHGVKLTIESEKPFANACATYDDNVMLEAVERGHGVGTHCDFGKSDPPMPVVQYALKFIANREPVDALVGTANNRHCSGGMGKNDWVTAAALAGFLFRSEGVALGYLPMPLSTRPAGWTDAYIQNVVFHEEVPVDLAERVHPFPMAEATEDWLADAGAEHIFLGGGLGRLDGMAEDAAGLPVGPNPPFTTGDVDEALARIAAAMAARDPGRVARVNIHLAITTFDAVDAALLGDFFEAVRTTWVEGGPATFATQGEAYDTYLAWTSCPADLDRDGVVDGGDIGCMLATWGDTGGASGAGAADLDLSGTIDAADLGALLAAWGSCAER